MIDVLEMMRPQIAARPRPGRFGLAPQGYALLTLHRPGNVDDPQKLGAIVEALLAVADGCRWCFRFTRGRGSSSSASASWSSSRKHTSGHPLAGRGLSRFPEPDHRRAASLTDSGGVQEETTYLGIPCLSVAAEHRAADHRHRRHQPADRDRRARRRDRRCPRSPSAAAQAARVMGRAHRAAVDGKPAPGLFRLTEQTGQASRSATTPGRRYEPVCTSFHVPGRVSWQEILGGTVGPPLLRS